MLKVCLFCSPQLSLKKKASILFGIQVDDEEYIGLKENIDFIEKHRDLVSFRYEASSSLKIFTFKLETWRMCLLIIGGSFKYVFMHIMI